MVLRFAFVFAFGLCYYMGGGGGASIRIAIAYKDIDKIGSTAYLKPYQPETGSNLNFTANNKINIKEKPKSRMETPIIPPTRATASIHEFLDGLPREFPKSI